MTSKSWLSILALATAVLTAAPALAQRRHVGIERSQRMLDDTDEQELAALTGLERGARDQPFQLCAHGLRLRAGDGHIERIAFTVLRKEL